MRKQPGFVSYTHAVILLVAFGAALACGSSGDDSPSTAGTCVPYVVPAGTDLSTPPVGFRSGVVPVFQQSCVFSVCHGGSAGKLTLSLSDPSAAHKALVGVASSEHKTMPRVTAGDPGKSFLMHKMDGDACTLQAECIDPECADVMPKDTEPLEVKDRDVVRRWIAQGAKDD